MEFQTLAEFLAQLYPKEAEIFRFMRKPTRLNELENGRLKFLCEHVDIGKVQRATHHIPLMVEVAI